jgi:hypothetical protein
MMSINPGVEAPAEAPITETDVAGFAAKLEAWYETLPPAEQAVLQRLLACAEGMAPEELDVAGYAFTGIGARVARLCAAGLMAATLAAPLAASAAPGFVIPGNAVTAHQITQPPEPVILAKALALGANFTGSQLSGLESVPNGFRIRYQNCDIYYSDAIGVHEVHGDIQTKYNASGGPAGPLGLPATDVQTTSDGIGRYSQFSKNASIYRTPDTGPHEIGGIIRSQWVVQGAETSRFGYPTSGLQSANGGQWIDFQNDVIYLEGTLEKATENVELSRAQLSKWLYNFIENGKSGDDWQIEGFTIRSVSDTGYGFSQSQNRRVTVRIEGRFVRELARDPHYTMDLELSFFTQKEADGSTSLRMKYVEHSLSIGQPPSDYDELWVGGILHPFMAPGWDYRTRPNPRPLKLIDMTIPAAVPVVSFKVMDDGRIKLLLQPGGGAPLVVQAVHFAFDRLAQ